MKRFLSLLLALAMIVTMLPQLTVFASEEQSDVTVEPVVPETSIPQEQVPEASEGDDIVVDGDLPTDPNDVYEYAKNMDFSAGGTVTAVCPVCGTEAQWQPLAAIDGSAAVALESGHYYLSDDIANAYHYAIKSTKVCINLNGHMLDTKVRAFYVSGAGSLLNVMGEGVVSGTGSGSGTSSRGVMDFADNGNLFGGTYISTNPNAPAVEVRTSGANLNVYAGTKILNSEGGNAVGAFNYGVLNVYGGSLGAVYNKGGTGTIFLSGAPVIENLDMTGGMQITVGDLTPGADITVYADGVFTNEFENAHAYVGYFTSGVEGKVIMVENNALAVGEDIVVDGDLPTDPNDVYEYAKNMDFSAGGTVTAVCPVCGTEEQWQPLPENQTFKAMTLQGHYYVSYDLGSVGYYYIPRGLVCINLNGHMISDKSSNGVAFWNRGASTVLNIMGDGVVEGSCTEVVDPDTWLNGVLSLTANTNLYGGTYISGSPNEPTVSLSGSNGIGLNIYEGTKILNNEGEVAVNLCGNGDHLNVCGGTVGTVRFNQNVDTTVTVSGAPVIEKLELAEGKQITVGDLALGADITVYADGVFTQELENAEGYLYYFAAGEEGKYITVENNALAVTGDSEGTGEPEVTVSSVDIQPVTLTVNNGGAQYDGYYQYYWWMDMQFTITMSDGSVIKGAGSSFDYNGEYVSIDTSDDQRADNPWLPGNTYYGTASVMGVEVSVPVTIEDSFISSIVFQPLEIRENTLGGEVWENSGAQNYFKYYWWNELRFDVYTKSGEVISGHGAGFWCNGVWYNFSASDDQSYANPWTAGNSYSGKVSVAGYETWVSVSITQNPVVSIVFDPISIMENTNGFWNSDASYGTNYYYYQWWNAMNFTVTFADGCVNSYTGLGFDHHGEWFDFGSGDSQGAYSPWTAGNTYTVNVSFQNEDFNVPVTITEAEVTAIAVKPLSIPAGSCGSLIRSEDGGNDVYFRYEWWKYVSYTVTFRDGTTMEVTGDTFQYNGIFYTLEHSDDQYSYNSWTEGSTHNVTLSVPGCSAETQISISAPQADKLDLPELVLGGYNEASIQNPGEIAVFKFIPAESGQYTFTSNAGLDTYGYLYDGGYRLITSNDDDGNENNFLLAATLTAGEVYIIAARFYGSEYAGAFPVSVTKSLGIQRVEFQPISIPVNTCGSYEAMDSGMNTYYRYYWWNRLSYTVYFENGDSINTGGTGFWYGDNYYALDWSDSQSAMNPWTEGNTYGAQVTVGGQTYAVPVTIESSPIASVNLYPYAMAQEGYGYYNTYWNDSTQCHEEYFQYYWWNCINYEITFKDGTSTSGSGSGYHYDGQWYSFEYEDNQYENPWKVGGVYYPVVVVGGQRYEVQVSVQPVKVQSITLEPVVLMEHTGGSWQNSYSGQYYEYYWWNHLRCTVVFENGAVLSGNGSSIYYNNQWINFQYSDNQNYENQYVLGGSYTQTLRLFGYETTVQICITDTIGGIAGENVAWTLDSNGNFTLSGSGALYEYSGSNDMEWERYKESIRTVTVGEGITHLGRFAFYGCYNLESVTFSSTVEDVGDYSFYQCSSLREVSFSDSVTVVGERAFQDCTALESITLGSNVTEIRDYAFSYCTNLREVTLPATLKVLGNWAFYPCSDLQTVYFMGTEMAWSIVEHRGHTGLQSGIEVQCLGVAEILTEGTCGDLSWKVDSDNVLTFEGTGVIPDYTEEALPEWKAYAEQILVVKLGEGITEIGNYAFYEFPMLQRVDMETLATRVGDYAFYNCDSLDAFNFYEADVVGSYAFAECDGFFYAYFGSDWTSIGDYAFYHNGITEVEYTGPGYKFYQENIGIENENLLNANLYSMEEEGVVLSGRCGESVYFIHYETGEVKLFGEGAMFDYDFVERPWERFSYPIFAITIEEGITYIGNYAFAHCGNAKTLTIPGTVTRIGEGAFWDLANVKTVTIPEGVEEIAANAFNFSGMDELNLPDSLKLIGSEAFRQCDCLTEITIPKGVETIEQKAFMACHALTSIRVDEENAFFSSDDRGVLYNKDQTVLVCAPGFISGSFAVPETVQRIEAWAFAHCTDLSEVVMGDNVTEIGVFAFTGCYALSSVTFGSGITKLPNGVFMEAGLSEFTIPEGITSIGSNAFQGCEHLTKVVIPETVTEIGEYAFAYCLVLTEANIPSSVTYIGQYAFYQCDMLSQVTVSEGITEIGEFAFADCTELTSITIPESVETIGAYAFIGCTNLTDLTIGKNVTAIGDSAFEGCVALKEVSVPEGVTDLVYRLFAGCTSLEKVDIPGTVQSIGDMTFADCNTLTEITVPDSVETIGDYAFKQCENLSVVNIGKSVSQMGADLFYDCNLLTAIRVHQANPVYSSDSYGALYQQTNRLVRVPAKLSGEFVIPDGVEDIEYGAFTGCCELTSVVVPGSVKVITVAAFQDCYGLTSVTLNEGVEVLENMAFAFCTALEEIVIPSTVTYIGGEAFVDCHALKSVALPEGIGYIEPYTFAWCYALETVTIPKSVTAIYNSAFAGCNELKEVIYGGTMSDWMQVNIWDDNYALQNAAITFAGDDEVLDSGSCGENAYWSLTVGGKLTVFGEGAINDYSLYDGSAPWAAYALDIRSVDVQEGITRVGNNAFGHCENMTSITIAGSVTELGSQCFFGCSALRNVELSEGLKTIGRNAFAECRSLAEIVLPGTVEFLGETAFAYTDLLELYIPASVTTIEGDLFYNTMVTGIFVDAANANYASDVRGVLYNKELTTLLRAPGGINGGYVVPEGVETIAGYAFFPCRNLNEIHLPESLKTVAAYAFYNCDNLQYVYYAGSQNTWSDISFGESNQCLLNANIYFSIEDNLGEGTCGDNLTWVLTPDGVLTISGTGAMYDYFNTPTQLPWKDLTDQIVSVTVEEGVTTIGEIAFKNCVNLRTVTLPDSLIEIGADAFYNCDSLEELSLPKRLSIIQLRAFANCDRLMRVYPNYELGVIGDSAFADCHSLVEFHIVGGVVCIGEKAFLNTGLTALILPDTLQEIGEYAFAGTPITELTIECSDVVILTELSKGAFKDCTALTAVNLGTNLQVLGEEVFSGCSALESILIPDSLSEIGANAFRNCTSLFEIRIPDAVQTIREYTFSGCTNLNYVFMHGVKTIGDYAFYSAGFTFVDSTPELETIGIGAFASCSRLGSFISAPKLREIGPGAFQDCVSLSSVNLPEVSPPSSTIPSPIARALPLWCCTTVCPTSAAMPSWTALLFRSWSSSAPAASLKPLSLMRATILCCMRSIGLQR